MLRKKDLVEQFELVVKQEIIEHNKAVESTNLAINKLRKDLEDLNATLSKDIIKMALRVTDISKDQSEIVESLDKIKFLFTNLSNEQYSINLRNHNEISIIDQSVETVHRNQLKSDKQIDELKNKMSMLKTVLREILKDNESGKVRISNMIIKAVKKVKDEILNRPSEIEAAKNEFMKELSMHKIDNEGLLKEIAVLKKDCFVKEKQIENLYTLIERINNKLT